VEFNHDGDLLAAGSKGGRVVMFQRDPIVSILTLHTIPLKLTSRKKERKKEFTVFPALSRLMGMWW